MLDNQFRNDVVRGVFNYIQDQITAKYYMSHDGKAVMKPNNIRYNESNTLHHIYHSEDISFADFLFKTLVCTYDESCENASCYTKWESLVELWNGNWKQISSDEFFEFVNKVKGKFAEYKEIYNGK